METPQDYRPAGCHALAGTIGTSPYLHKFPSQISGGQHWPPPSLTWPPASALDGRAIFLPGHAHTKLENLTWSCNRAKSDLVLVAHAIEEAAFLEEISALDSHNRRPLSSITPRKGGYRSSDEYCGLMRHLRSALQNV
jgi:hypothetical protein